MESSTVGTAEPMELSAAEAVKPNEDQLTTPREHARG